MTKSAWLAWEAIGEMDGEIIENGILHTGNKYLSKEKLLLSILI